MTVKLDQQGEQEWQECARSGRRLQAVILLRRLHNSGVEVNDPKFMCLREAVRIVDKYIEERST
jgi:hypothetical protein